jgi:hypothetical protein
METEMFQREVCVDLSKETPSEPVMAALD